MLLSTQTLITAVKYTVVQAQDPVLEEIIKVFASVNCIMLNMRLCYPEKKIPMFVLALIWVINGSNAKIIHGIVKLAAVHRSASLILEKQVHRIPTFHLLYSFPYFSTDFRRT